MGLVEVLHSEKMQGLSQRVETTYVNPLRRKNRGFPNREPCGKTCGECGKLRVINKIFGEMALRAKSDFRLEKCKIIGGNALWLRVMLPRISADYFGKNRQKVGKMYNSPPLPPGIPLGATENFVEIAQNAQLYDFLPAWDTDFILSRSGGTLCREK